MKLHYRAPGAHGSNVVNGLGSWTPGETKDVPDHRENYAKRLVKAGGFVILPDAPPPPPEPPAERFPSMRPKRAAFKSSNEPEF